MNRGLLAIGPAILLLSCAVALAQDRNAAVPAQPVPGGDYLLTLGPYGALVWGAYLIGKGVRVTVQVELSERDRSLIEVLTSRGRA